MLVSYTYLMFDRRSDLASRCEVSWKLRRAVFRVSARKNLDAHILFLFCFLVFCFLFFWWYWGLNLGPDQACQASTLLLSYIPCAVGIRSEVSLLVCTDSAAFGSRESLEQTFPCLLQLGCCSQVQALTLLQVEKLLIAEGRELQCTEPHFRSWLYRVNSSPLRSARHFPDGGDSYSKCTAG